MADRNGGAHYDGALTRKEMELYKAKMLLTIIPFCL